MYFPNLLSLSKHKAPIKRLCGYLDLMSLDANDTYSVGAGSVGTDSEGSTGVSGVAPSGATIGSFSIGFIISHYSLLEKYFSRAAIPPAMKAIAKVVNQTFTDIRSEKFGIWVS